MKKHTTKLRSMIYEYHRNAQTIAMDNLEMKETQLELIDLFHKILGKLDKIERKLGG